MQSNQNTPPTRGPGAAGVPESDERDTTDTERAEDSPAPKTSGAAPQGKEPLPNPIADRNPQGPREAGITPRPTDKPVIGGDNVPEEADPRDV
ncbi:hypothetical protein [Limoniibacter endophyticus]|uniref:Uncharacterized protein n=1 Tax=Limoniibacter endophyticus TaxID=1565040 RepID=A0A8J3DUV8_9HYPH|nr:hypothetical protein [Limoniibacter endophyticus]GHC79492.1 hypothetical protein GCM10010136_32080 [Limoniibacter endophyticus]